MRLSTGWVTAAIRATTPNEPPEYPRGHRRSSHNLSNSNSNSSFGCSSNNELHRHPRRHWRLRHHRQQSREIDDRTVASGSTRRTVCLSAWLGARASAPKAKERPAACALTEGNVLASSAGWSIIRLILAERCHKASCTPLLPRGKQATTRARMKAKGRTG